MTLGGGGARLMAHRVFTNSTQSPFSIGTAGRSQQDGGGAGGGGGAGAGGGGGAGGGEAGVFHKAFLALNHTIRRRYIETCIHLNVVLLVRILNTDDIPLIGSTAYTYSILIQLTITFL